MAPEKRVGVDPSPTRAIGAKSNWRVMLSSILEHYLIPVQQIWTDQYPQDDTGKHSRLAKALLTLVLVQQALSLSNLRFFFEQKPSEKEFMSYYVVTWLFMLLCSLLLASYLPTVFAAIAGYRIVDIIGYRVYFLLVKSRTDPWGRDSLRRSMVIVFLNACEIAAAYAILYVTLGSIGPPGSKTSAVLDPLTAIYFSFVTMLTVGYGDLVPLDRRSRAIVLLELLSAFLFLLIVIPALVSRFAADLQREKKP